MSITRILLTNLQLARTCFIHARQNVSHPSFLTSFPVFKLLSLYSSGSFLRSESENKGLCLKPRGRMEVKPMKDQSMCSQALRRNRCLWSPPFCGQDGELLLAALDLCLLYLKGTFHEEILHCIQHCVRKGSTSSSKGIWLSRKNSQVYTVFQGRNCAHLLCLTVLYKNYEGKMGRQCCSIPERTREVVTESNWLLCKNHREPVWNFPRPPVLLLPSFSGPFIDDSIFFRLVHCRISKNSCSTVLAMCKKDMVDRKNSK